MGESLQKRTDLYDGNGNNTEEAEYYADANTEFEYNRGKLYEYDHLNHRILEININSSVNGPYFTGRTNWEYGNDNLLDIVQRCHYGYPDQDNCHNVIMFSYDYLGQDTIVENGFIWDEDAWKYYGRELSFRGQGIYSDKPDSIIYYDYKPDQLLHIPTIRRYFQYIDLGNQKVYFKDVTYTYFENEDTWNLTSLMEEWYHIQGSVSVDEHNNDDTDPIVFPNPCRKGQEIYLQFASTDNKSSELLIFDIQGQLISTQVVHNTATITAPTNTGLHTILVRSDNHTLVLPNSLSQNRKKMEGVRAAQSSIIDHQAKASR